MDIGSLAQMGQNMLKNAGGASADGKAADAVTAMIPKEILDKLPPAVRTLAASQAVDQVAKQAPEILEVISKGGKLTGADSEKLKAIVTNVFQGAVKQSGK